MLLFYTEYSVWDRVFCEIAEANTKFVRNQTFKYKSASCCAYPWLVCRWCWSIVSAPFSIAFINGPLQERAHRRTHTRKRHVLRDCCRDFFCFLSSSNFLFLSFFIYFSTCRRCRRRWCCCLLNFYFIIYRELFSFSKRFSSVRRLVCTNKQIVIANYYDSIAFEWRHQSDKVHIQMLHQKIARTQN